MSLHQAEWVAGELIAVTVAGLALVWVWRQHKRQEPPRDDQGRSGTTQYSSMNDD